MRRTFLSSLILVFAAGCSNFTKEEQSVGVDPSWYPLQLPGREKNITAFSTELLKEIGDAEKIPFIKFTVSWDNLLSGLKKKKYNAIFSSMPPYIFNEKIFDFSDVFLPIGPVLVMPMNSNVKSIKMLKGKEIAVLPDTEGALLLSVNPDVLIRIYDSVPKALADILNQTVDGAIIDVLTASAYCEDIYYGQLKIATPPLNDAGLRLITLHNEDSSLIRNFNQGLRKLKSSGSYHQLLEKWNLKSLAPDKSAAHRFCDEPDFGFLAEAFHQ